MHSLNLTFESLLNKTQAAWAFNYLLAHVPWQQDVYNFSGKEVKAPRLTARYGADYHYSGLKTPSLPLDSVLSKLLDLVQLKTESTFVDSSNKPFNSILLNYYRDGRDSIGLHSDNEAELGLSPVVASLSLGETREIKFQHNKTKRVESWMLEDGDYLLMHAGTQEHWKHTFCLNVQKYAS